MTGQAEADETLVAGIRTAYAGGVDGWAAGPAVVYQRLAEAERARGGTDPVPTQLVLEEAAQIVAGLLEDPAPLVTALDTT
ncbi:MAG: hypothetical protein R6V28_14410, partial [Nitriliruptoraceae bacterium]